MKFAFLIIWLSQCCYAEFDDWTNNWTYSDSTESQLFRNCNSCTSCQPPRIWDFDCGCKCAPQTFWNGTNCMPCPTPGTISSDGNSCNCPSPLTFLNGTCQCPSGYQLLGNSCVVVNNCPSGFVRCADVCVSMQMDPNNCGGCGLVCSGVNRMCVNGVCDCMPGFRQCGGSNCIAVMNDPNNCGSCGVMCPGGALRQCTAGVCGCTSNSQMMGGVCTSTGSTCAPPNFLCGSSCILPHDLNNCGGCGLVCSGVNRMCVNGVCDCMPGFRQCGGSNCIAVMNDPNNCGNCGVMCPGGALRRCTAGVCGCAPPYRLVGNTCIL